ncbi:hypothetical protein [Burkholderia lata]|uniref:hypothetical protein n=1 Tax=Burkholderia lata (strain ATCC 17760 / DSM 23089 / LMG 22485 / NCIMB 9086 / R18194 / 383) TaxID=482957 RepID=UPI001452C2E4|nr:hypothetical protein [Burkholderia lata]VWB88459.1 hypothetical protein BLA15816_04252 [Burkholderia lata]
MYDTITPELMDVIDGVKTLSEQPASVRLKFDDTALALQLCAQDIALHAVKLADPLMRQSATTVADGLNAAAKLCRIAKESES